MQSTLDGLVDVFCRDRFCRIVADSAWGPQKNHSCANLFRENHRIVAGAARHPMRHASCSSDREVNFIDEKGIHWYGLLAQQHCVLDGQSAPPADLFGLSNQIGNDPVTDLVGMMTHKI